MLPSHPTLQTCRSPATRPVHKQLTHMQKRTQGEHKQCLYLLRGSSLKLSDNPIQTASILSKGVITAIFSPLSPCLSCYGGFSLHIIGANKEINRKTEQCEFALYLIKLLNYSKGLEAWFSWIKLIFQCAYFNLQKQFLQTARHLIDYKTYSLILSAVCFQYTAILLIQL